MTPRRHPRLAAGAALAALVAACTTRDGAAEPVVPPVTAAPLPEVVTTATRAGRDPFELPMAIDRIDATQLQEARPQVNLSESLGRVPGIVVRNRENYAQDLQISARGFGTRAAFGIRGIRLLQDGIPATMPDGQGQVSSFALSSADRVEVLRGPFSSLYGNASGGVIQIFTADAPRQPALNASALAGGFGTWRAGVGGGGQFGALNALVDATRFETAGFRARSAARRDLLNARLRWQPDQRQTFTLIANALDMPDTQDPLGLRRAQVEANPRQADASGALFNTRKTTRQAQTGLNWTYDLGGGRELAARGYVGQRRVVHFLAIPLAAQNAPTSSGGVVDLDRDFGGLALRYTQRGTLAGAPLTLTAGIDYDRMAERRRGHMNLFGVQGALKRDEDNTVRNLDLYVQGEWQPAPRWSLSAGVRRSDVRFDSRDAFIAAGNPDDSGSARYTQTTPMAGAVFRATPALNLYANIGRGFETPTFAELAYRPAGAPGLNFGLLPARSLHRELGAKARLGNWGRLNAALFRIDTSDEIVVHAAAGGRTSFRNAGRTQRDGFELAWEAWFAGGFEAHIAYTWLDARFRDAFQGGSAAVVAAGNSLPGVPRHSLYAEALWRHAASGFHAGAEFQYLSAIAVDDVNSEFASAFGVLHLRAGFEQRHGGWRASQFVRVNNVADRRYIGSVIVGDTNRRFYEPAPGRNWMVGANVTMPF